VKRSYHQYCGLAAALDVVGERWALLIVRDLAPGPRRYTDLLAGLPGMATDVLTDRLRALEAAGAVVQRPVKHPVPARVYELTDRGRELERIAGALARWGTALLPAPASSGYRFSPRWTLQSMAVAYRSGLLDGDYHWTIDDEELTLMVAGPSAKITYGHTGGEPVLAVRCSAKAFFALFSEPPRRRARTPEGVDVTGRPEVLADLVRSMPLPSAAAT